MANSKWGAFYSLLATRYSLLATRYRLFAKEPKPVPDTAALHVPMPIACSKARRTSGGWP